MRIDLGFGLAVVALSAILFPDAFEIRRSWSTENAFSHPVDFDHFVALDEPIFCFVFRAFEGTWFGKKFSSSLCYSFFTTDEIFLCSSIVLVSQSNHVVMDVAHDDSSMSWFRLQLKATCNIAKSPFNDWFTGHLNFQIEHQSVLIRRRSIVSFPFFSSLFPMMPRHNLYKIQADVMELCRKHQIPYIVKPLGKAFLDILT